MQYLSTQKKTSLIFGCVADDFTGGSDAASFMSLGGMKTIFCNGIPGPDFSVPEGCEGIVIALKSRTQDQKEAVRDSLEAFRYLRSHGARYLFFKYCSTFDSTEKGNIGPVTDAVLETFEIPGTILCPALPANGRLVKNGLLYVNGIPLGESSMRNHPLTPMTKSRIADLMEPQGRYQSMEISSPMLYGDEEALQRAIASFSRQKEHYYLIPDCENDTDAERIAALFGDLPFLTGGSGILKPLAAKIVGNRKQADTIRGTQGKALLLAGSCSTATHAQTLFYEKQGGTLIRLIDEALQNGSQTPGTIWSSLASKETKKAAAPLVYAYDSPEGLAKKRASGDQTLPALIEHTLSEIASLAVQNGYKRIIVAGGETSGAVTQALGFQAFWIGESIAPGVPVLIPVERPDIRLVLKSGNFGQEDFFCRALQITDLHQKGFIS